MNPKKQKMLEMMIDDIADLEMDSPYASNYLRDKVTQMKSKIFNKETYAELETLGVSARKTAADRAKQEEIERMRPKPFNIAEWIED